MTPLEQHVREALQNDPNTAMYSRADILTALRTLLEQQAAAVATLTADPEHATCRAVEQRLRRANRRLQAQGDELERDPLIMELRRVVATLMAERDEARDLARKLEYIEVVFARSDKDYFHALQSEARKKIAAWSRETR